MSKARELAELSRTVSDSADATAITINSSEEVTFADDIFLGDGKKVVLGAGSDLQIFHDTNHSYIEETGDGALKLKGDDIRLENSSGNNIIKAVGNSAELYENGSKKLETTSSGIAITGSVTATSLIASNGVLELDDNGSHNGIINSPASLFVNIDSDNGSTGEDFIIGKDRTSTTGGTELFRVQEDGKVGIGTTPSSELHVKGADETQIYIEAPTGSNSGIRLLENGTSKWTIGNDQSNDGLFFYDFAASAERMRITNDGKLIHQGKSGTSPIFEMINNDNENNDTGRETSLRFSGHRSGGQDAINAQISGHHSGNADDDKGMLFFYTNNGSGLNEAMRLTSGGILAVGDGTPENSAYATTKRLYLEGAESVQMIKNLSASDSANRVAIGFLNSSGTAIGNISNNSSATNYTTSSDYRLKENVTYNWDALTRLKQLKPARFNWITDNTNTLVDGFLAHEAQEVVPEAVTGEHNETKDLTNVVLNEFGNVIAKEVTEDEWKSGKEAENPVYAANTTWKAEHTQDVYQAIDQSKLVPLLVKAMQEQQTLIESLQAEVAALKGA